MDMKTCAIVSLAYLTPTYIFYLFFTIYLFKKNDRELKTPFFNIVKLIGIIDLIFIPIQYISNRIGSFETFYPFFDNFVQKNFICTIITYLYCVLQHAQFLAHFLLSANRLSAVLMMNSYKRYWSTKHFWKYALTVIGLPVIYMSWLLYFGSNMSYWPGYNYGIDSFKTGLSWLKKSTFCLFVGCLTCAVSFIMDLITFTYICTKPLIDAKTHIRLLAVSATSLVINIVYMFFTVGFFVTKIELYVKDDD